MASSTCTDCTTCRVPRNMGRTESIIRMVAGVAILGAGVYFGSLWGLVGLIPLITGATGYCPVYSLFGRKSHC